jgi:hypothetical protein
VFLVSDSLESRQTKIETIQVHEPAIAVLVAASDFEWTLRRAIYRLGKSSTKEMKDKVLFRINGLSRYEKAWNREVKPRFGKELKDLIPDWGFFEKTAYNLRNKLVHGEQGTTSLEYASRCVRALLTASAALTKFAEENGEPIYGERLPRRMKPRE